MNQRDQAIADAPPVLPEDRSRLLDMAPGRLWVSDLGPAPVSEQRPALLLLHSILVTGWDFRFFGDSLAAGEHGRRVLAPDLFGCGNSDRPEAHDTAGYGFEWHAELLGVMLDKLAVSHVDLVGHGYGGSIAIHLARRLERGQHRVALRRLILIAPHCLPVEAPIAMPGPMPRLRRAWSWVGLAPLVFRTVFRRADLRRYLLRSLSNPALLDSPRLRDDVDVYWDRLCRDGGLEATQAMLAQLDRLHEYELDGVRERLVTAARSLESPTMVVWGDRDDIIPTALAERTAAMIPGARLRIVESCGHAPHREQPEALQRVFDGFERELG